MFDRDETEALLHEKQTYSHSCPCMSQRMYSPGVHAGRSIVQSELSPLTPFPKDVTLRKNQERDGIKRMTSTNVCRAQPGAMKPCQLTLQRVASAELSGFPGTV